jgi:hypothetical protein
MTDDNVPDREDFEAAARKYGRPRRDATDAELLRFYQIAQTFKFLRGTGFEHLIED